MACRPPAVPGALCARLRDTGRAAAAVPRVLLMASMGSRAQRTANLLQLGSGGHLLANSAVWMPGRALQQPTSCAWAIRSSASVGTDSSVTAAKPLQLLTSSGASRPSS